MSDVWVSCNEAYVKLGARSYSFSKWSLPVECVLKLFNAFGNGGYQIAIPGSFKASPKCEGPYNAGNMPLTPGAEYELHLGLLPGLEFVVNARLGTVEYGAQVGGSDPAQCSVTFESTGQFGVAYT